MKIPYPKIAKIAVTAFIVTQTLGAVSGLSQSVTYIYDNSNRLEKAQYEGGTVIEYTYDKTGFRLTENAISSLRNVIYILKILTGTAPQGEYSTEDINGDGEIGMEELIYEMEKLTGIR